VAAALRAGAGIEHRQPQCVVVAEQPGDLLGGTQVGRARGVCKGQIARSCGGVEQAMPQKVEDVPVATLERVLEITPALALHPVQVRAVTKAGQGLRQLLPFGSEIERVQIGGL